MAADMSTAPGSPLTASIAETQSEKRKKKGQQEKIFPEGKQQMIPGETDEERRLRFLRSRLRPLINHPYFGKRLDTSDSHLKKWLTAADNSVLYAAAKIRKCLELRWKLKIDTVLTDYKPPEVLRDYYAGGLCGVDRQGCPVLYELFGVNDMKGIVLSVTKHDLVKFKLFQFESIIKHMKKTNKETGRSVDSLLMIVDMHPASKNNLWGPSLRIWAEMIEMLQDFYPGLVKEVLIIRPHQLYPEIYLALRPYMKRPTLGLIKVLGTNYLRYLESRIEKHEIPAYLGGYKCDPDGNPLCRTHIKWREAVPTWMYMTDPNLQAHGREYLIQAGLREVDEYHVPLAHSVMTWQFTVINQPIILSIYLNKVEERSCLVKHKCLTMDSPHRNGSIVCRVPGRYLFVMDNCRNYTTWARVFCKVVTTPPVHLPHSGNQVPLGDRIDFWQPMKQASLESALKSKQ
ncbi:SEC14-like protein 3 [Physella acuta]|uniref:SEC14-like protein 3 n=1 Tax=Physella acuta TaxID=109671 RepID=UPI0027DB5ACE|nr:SEC14-like protein 3 [Physella acuta]XP_059164052.1 SEC14-like protein 3 [Physella acuta]